MTEVLRQISFSAVKLASHFQFDWKRWKTEESGELCLHGLSRLAVPPALTTLASPLTAPTVGLFRREVLGCAGHSPGQTDKSVEDVLGNLNLGSSVTPQMMNLGLSQERESASVRLDTGQLREDRTAVFFSFRFFC